MEKKETVKYKDKQKLALLDYVIGNPNYFNPRNVDDFININEAMLMTKYLDRALDRNRLGHYPNDSNYFIPNPDVTNLVRMVGNKSGISDSKTVVKMTKDLLRNMNK